MSAFASLTPQRWFCTVLSVLVILAITYFWLHASLTPGRSRTKLTQNDIATISSLLYTGLVAPSDSVTGNTTNPAATILSVADRPLTDSLRSKVLAYITRTYPVDPTDVEDIRQWLNLFIRPANLINALDSYILPVHSYFWLYDGRLYAEVIFWVWFGLIASLLYSVSELLRKGDEAFDRNEVWVHIAKFFYAPLIAIVLFLGLSIAINDKTVIERIDYSANQILVAFIMGFFSGRFVQLLQNIKNVLFPDTQSAATSAATTTPTAATDADIRLAVERLGDRWRLTYPNVTGIALQNKQTADQPTGQLSALFEVSRKVTDLRTGGIPAFLPFTTPDSRFVNVPTDVVEVGVTHLATYVPGTPLHENVPTAPGGSIRRSDLTTWGTLGLLLSDGHLDYVLTCYHVLCADLLANNQFSVVDQTKNVVVPGVGKGSTSIGTLVGGRFTETNDFALVRLSSAQQVKTRPIGLPETFYDIIDQPGDSLLGKTVFMVGACSNFQTAKVQAPYQAGEYSVPDLKTSVTLKGLLKTDRMANHGDSGAAVFVEENGHKRVVGLLIGFNDLASYVLPIDGQFLKQFNVGIP